MCDGSGIVGREISRAMGLVAGANYCCVWDGRKLSKRVGVSWKVDIIVSLDVVAIVRIIRNQRKTRTSGN